MSISGGDKDIKTVGSPTAAGFPAELPKPLTSALEKLIPFLEAKTVLKTFKENISKIKSTAAQKNTREIYKDAINKLRADLLQLMNDQNISFVKAVYETLIQIARYLPSNEKFTVDMKGEIETVQDPISIDDLKLDQKETVILAPGNIFHIDSIIRTQKTKKHYNAAMDVVGRQTAAELSARDAALLGMSANRETQTVEKEDPAPLTNPYFATDVPCHPLDAFHIISIAQKNKLSIPRLSLEMKLPHNPMFTLVHAAAMYGETELFFVLTKSPYNFPKNVEDSYGATPLYYAIRENHQKIVNACTPNVEAEITKMNAKGDAMIHIAARMGDVRMLTMIPFINETTKDKKYFPVHLAALNNRGEFIREAYKLGINIYQKSGESPPRTALDIAIQEKKDDALRAFSSDKTFFDNEEILLIQKVHVLSAMPAEAFTDELKQKLSAQEKTIIDCLKNILILTKPTDIAAKKMIEDTFNQKTALGMLLKAPLHEAVLAGNISTMEFYIKELHRLGININCLNTEGITPLYLAFEQDNQAATPMVGIFHELKLPQTPIYETTFQSALKQNHATVIHRPVFIEHIKDFKEPPLHFAARTNLEKVIPTLIQDFSQPIDQKNKEGNTALHQSILSTSNEAAIALLNFNANYNAQNNQGFTPLYLTVLRDNQIVLQHIAKKDSEKDSKDAKPDVTQLILKNMDQLLLLAAQSDDLKMFKKLLNYFSEENKKYFSRAVHYAAYFDRADFIKELHARKFDLNSTVKSFTIKDNKRIDLTSYSSPIVFASSLSKRNALEALKKLNVQVTLRGFISSTPNNHEGIRKILESKLATIDEIDDEKNTVLHHAVVIDEKKFEEKDSNKSPGIRRAELIALLVQQKASIHAKNKAGDTPLHLYAKTPGKLTLGVLSKIQTHLIDSKNVNEKNLSGDTPLHLAVTAKNNLANSLIAKGADAHQENNEKKSPLELADPNQLKEIAETKLPSTVSVLYDTIKRNIEKSIVTFKTAGIVPDGNLLSTAVEKSDLDMVKTLRERYSITHGTDQQTVLHLVVAHQIKGNFLSEYLKQDAKADWHAEDDAKETPITYALIGAEGANDFLKEAFKRDIELNTKEIECINDKTPDDILETLYAHAKEKQNKVLFEKLLPIMRSKNMLILKKEIEDAIKSNDTNTLKLFFVETKGNKNLPLINYKNALHAIASLKNSSEETFNIIFDEKSDEKIDWTAKDSKGTSIISRAIQSKNTDFLKRTFANEDRAITIAQNEVAEGNTEALKEIFENHIDRNKKIPDHASFLHLAALTNNKNNVVEYCADAKTEWHPQDKNGLSPIALAINLNHNDFLKSVRDKKIMLDEKEIEKINGNTSPEVLNTLYELAKNTNQKKLLEKVFKLLMVANVVIVGEEIQKAIKANDTATLEFLFREMKVPKDIRLPNYHSPLHAAASLNSIDEVVDLITDEKTNWNLQDEKGNRPITSAIEARNHRFLKKLLLDEKDKKRVITIAQYEVQQKDNKQTIKEIFKEYAIDKNAVDEHKNTYAHLAALANNYDAIEFCTDSKTDWNAINDAKQTVGSIAILHEEHLLVDRLLDKGMKLSDADMNSAINMAKQTGKLATLKTIAGKDQRIFNQLTKNNEWKVLVDLLIFLGPDYKFLLKEKISFDSNQQQKIYDAFIEKIKTESQKDLKDVKEDSKDKDGKKDPRLSDIPGVSRRVKEEILDRVSEKRNLLGCIFEKYKFLDKLKKASFSGTATPAATITVAVSSSGVTSAGLFSAISASASTTAASATPKSSADTKIAPPVDAFFRTGKYEPQFLGSFFGLSTSKIADHISQLYSLLEAKKLDSPHELLIELVTLATQPSKLDEMKKDVRYFYLTPQMIEKLKDINHTCTKNKDHAVTILKELHSKITQLTTSKLTKK